VKGLAAALAGCGGIAPKVGWFIQRNVDEFTDARSGRE